MKGILVATTIECLLCEALYIHTYSLFQMCEVGDYHHFTGVADTTKKLRNLALCGHTVE